MIRGVRGVWLLAIWGVLAGLLASPVAAQGGTRYRVAPGEGEATAESLMAEELANLEVIEVAGDTLRYEEVEREGEIVRTASWTGNVVLLAGSIQLTTEALELVFLNEAPVPGTAPGEVLQPAPPGEPEIVSLTAGPVVEIRVRQDLVVVRGESLAFNFREQRGEVVHPTIEVMLPQEMLASLGDLPLSIGDVRTTIHGERVSLQDDDIAIERPEVALFTEGGRDLRLTASRMDILNPHPAVTRLRTRNLRVSLDDITLLRLPWTQTFTIRGSIPSGGFDLDFPSVFSAEEGLGLASSAHFVWDAGGAEEFVNTWSVGTRLEGLFGDRMYIQPYIAYQTPDVGQWRLGYGTFRGVSPLDNDSLPVYAAPELEWFGPPYDLADWLTVRPELGAGHLDERSSGRESDRVRATLLWSTRKHPLLGNDQLTGRLEGKLDQRWYEDGHAQRIAEAGIVLQYVEPGQFGTEVNYFRRDDTGFSPFLHDRLRLREEAGFRQKAIGPDGWNGLMRGMYDIEEDRWRRFELGVGKELELLEARLLYDTISDAIRFELGFVGEI